MVKYSGNTPCKYGYRDAREYDGMMKKLFKGKN